MKNLYVVGTSYNDTKGPTRLEKLIILLRPQFIMCEAELTPETIFRLHEEMQRTLTDDHDILVELYGETGYNKIANIILTVGYEACFA